VTRQLTRPAPAPGDGQLARRQLLCLGIGALGGSLLPRCRSTPGALLDASPSDVGRSLDQTRPQSDRQPALVDREREERLTFPGYKGLAALPYFQLDGGGRLRCTVPDLPPIVDFHTHFGFSYLLAPKIDLQASPPLQYLVDCDGATPPCTLNLDGYLNLIATPEMLKAMDGEIAASLLPGGSKAAETETIPNLLAEMDALGIAKAVVLAIELGLPVNDSSSEVWYDAIKAANATSRLLLYGSVRPGQNKIREKLQAFKAQGIRGVKLHPTMQRFYPDDNDAMEIYDECGKLNLPVFFHSGRAGIEPALVQKYAELKHYLKPVSDYPSVRFVFGHAGAALDFADALALAKTHKNVWLEMAGQGVTNLRTILTELGPERLLYGTDWPFYPEAVTLAKVLIITRKDKKVRDMLLSDNAEQFLKSWP
jgi:uncharacterized protein